MKLKNLMAVLCDQIQDLYSAETQLVKALPIMAKGATEPELKKAIENHLGETKNQLKRLEKIGKILGIEVDEKTCKAMKGLVEEGNEVLKEGGEPAAIDAALIGAAQRVEHYEIAAYGTARAFAETLGLAEVVELLSETLEEESTANETLTEIAISGVNEDAVDEGEEDEEDRPVKKSRSTTSTRP